MDLSDQQIGTNGAYAVAQLINSGDMKNGNVINLSDNVIGNRGALSIFEAVSSGNAPKNLTLIMRSMNVSHLVDFLSVALICGKCPEGLTIDVSENYAQLDHIEHLASALACGRCPRNMTIILPNLHIYPGKRYQQYMTFFMKALSSPKSPIGLSLNIGTYQSPGLNAVLFDNPNCLMKTDGKHSRSWIIRNNYSEAGKILKTEGWTSEVQTLLEAIPEVFTQTYADAQFLIFQHDRSLGVKNMHSLVMSLKYCSISALTFILGSHVLDKKREVLVEDVVNALGQTYLTRGGYESIILDNNILMNDLINICKEKIFY